MQVKISERIFEKWPETTVSGVAAFSIDVDMAAVEARAITELADEALVSKFDAGSHPRIVAWREVYAAFGAKPRSYQCSVERLLKRSFERGSIPRVSPLVDIGNAISALYVLPVGVEDMDKLSGTLELDFATGAEVAVAVVGESDARSPKPGEVIYSDGLGVICRRWNWKETPRAMVSDTTTNAVFIIETTRREDAEIMQVALTQMIGVLSCVAHSCVDFTLDREASSVTLHHDR